MPSARPEGVPRKGDRTGLLSGLGGQPFGRKVNVDVVAGTRSGKGMGPDRPVDTSVPWPRKTCLHRVDTG